MKYFEMDHFIETIQTRNNENGITGYLFEDGQYFLQYIEGKNEKVSELFDKMQKDPRHTIIFYTSKSILKRRFENWSMNYFEKTTPVEKLFLNLLMKQKKKAIRSINPFYGFFLKIFCKYRIWSIADRMYTAVQPVNSGPNRQ